MDRKGLEPLRKKSPNDMMRKKLEAELRATEEIARIKQSVIEKRLAVELASLEQEQAEDKHGDGREAKPAENGPPEAKSPVASDETDPANRRLQKKSVAPTKPEIEEIAAEAAAYSAFADVTLKKSPFCGSSFSPAPQPLPTTGLPELFKPLSGESDSENEDEQQPKKRGSFFKDVIRKWSKRMKSEDRKHRSGESRELVATADAAGFSIQVQEPRTEEQR